MGRRLVRILADRGHEVLALVHRAPEPAVAEQLSHERITVRVMDLERPDFKSLPKTVDSVIALAQSQYFRNFPERADEIFAINVAAQLRLLEWARHVGVQRFVYASSGGVYGPSARLAVAENELLAVDSPLGFYLGSKLCAEVMFQNYRHFFDTAVILRPFFIYGPGQKRDMLIPRLIDSVRNERAIQLQGPDGLRVNPIYLDDAAEGFAAALKVKGRHVLNLAGPDVVSLRSIGERIGRGLGRSPRFERIEGAPSDYVAITELANSLLGAPATGFDQGIAQTVDAEREVAAR